MKHFTKLRPSAAAPIVVAALLVHAAPASERSSAAIPPSFDAQRGPETSAPPATELRRPSAAPDATSSTPELANALRDGALGSIDHSRMYYDEPGDGALWARGARYKAKFSAEGATYYPLFGERQPRHLPHALSPDVVTVGGAPIAFERAADATRVGDRIEIHRGAFVEAYDMGADAIEQTFVFATLPRSGDVVVHIPIASELESRETDAALEFRGDLGHVEYGRAVAVDAAGRRTAAATELEDGAISIRVDAAFTASAQLPLVIDPVIATFPIDTDPPRNSTPDISMDFSAGAVVAVYEEIATAGDRDVVATTFNQDGTLRNTGYIDSTTASWTKPRSASNRNTVQSLVVAEVASGGSSSISGRRVNGLNHTMSIQFAISSGSEGNCNDPDIGGDPYEDPSSSFYSVVYTRALTGASAIVVRLVAPSATTAGSPQFVSPTTGFNSKSAISKSNGEANWMIVWQTSPTAGGSADVWGRRIDFFGGFVGAAFPIAATSANETTPRVSRPIYSFPSGIGTYMVAHEVQSGTDHDIVITLVNDSTVAQSIDLNVGEGVTAPDQIEPCVDTTGGGHFAVTYAESTGGGSYDTRVSEVGLAGGFIVILQPRVGLGTTAGDERRPRIVAGTAPTFSGGSVGTAYYVAWDSGFSAGGGDIQGAIFEPLVGGPKTPFCFGDGSGTACPCGNASAPGAQSGCLNSFGTAGHLVGTGNASTTTDTLVLQATGMSPAATTVTFFQGELIAGGGGGTVFGDGLRCTVGPTIRWSMPASSGSSNDGFGVAGGQLVSARGMIPASGTTRFYQVTYRNAASFCTSATFNTTNGLIVVWTP